jgi:azurin
MNTRITLLTAACALALVACGDKSPDTSADTAAAPTASEPAPDATAPVASTEPAPATTPTPADTTTAASAATTPGSDKPAAVVADCATEIEGTDAMQYNVGSIVVPASCTEFKITLKHTGTMPVAAMGHNVVITKAADMQAVAAEGMGAGAAAAYVKAGDARVIAHSSLIGGGETTSVSFPVSKIKDGGPYEFFCSFPGHSALMKGTIAVE